jgi:periplasmic protein TonB
MPPSAKDLDLSAARPQTTSAGPSTDASGKPQPVPLEVPVTVNGARTVEGSDKREPFSESTQTVLVFGNGAVIRLASAVTPGQLLFLTNDKTKKEVVCQVLKSKNYSTVSGYVELEFTEAVSGFWGVRFPGERVTAQPAAPAQVPLAKKTPVAAAPPVPKVQPLPASSLPKPQPLQVAPPQARTETVTTGAPKTETKPPVNLPHAAELAPTASPKAPAAPSSFGSGVTTTSRPPEIKPAAPVAPKAPPAAPAAIHTQNSSSDALKRESARLQEQLSSMLFAAEKAARPAASAPPAPAANKPAPSELAAKIIEMSKPQTPAAKVNPPPRTTPQTTPSPLDSEQVKIPSWLEPLARNAAMPAQNEPAAKVETPHEADVIEFEVQDVSAPTTTEETGVPALDESAMDLPAVDEIAASEHRAAKNNKMMLIGGMAAGFLLLAAGGTWYVRSSQSSAPSQPEAAAATSPATGSAAAAQPPARNAADVPAASKANAASASANRASLTPPAVSAQSIEPTAQPLGTAPEKSTAAELSAYKKLAEPAPQPAAIQPPSKKPSLGAVHLAAPAVKGRSATPDSDEADLAPALGATQVSPATDAMGGGLAAGGVKQPVAPGSAPTVGGDVHQAKLISSTTPIYPALAKSQRIEGNVQVDALIDVNGRVSSMKVVSGPTLLHQAAMEALRQWKYKAATLDGKPVPMHLNVTIQFRLQ